MVSRVNRDPAGAVSLTDLSMAHRHRILGEFESFLRSWDAAPQTIRARMVVISARFAEWGENGFTADNIRQWFASANLERWSRTTYYSHLNSFCEFLVTAGYATENPMEEVRKPKAPRSQPRPLSEAEVRRVTAAADGRVRDWLQLALLQGLRVHEIAKLRGEDVQAEGLFVRGKGGVEATLPVHADIWAMARRYPDHGWWFPGRSKGSHIQAGTITNAVTQLFRSVGVAGSIHRCRHTYGTRLLRAGAHIRQVQTLMRHGSLQTTALYTAVDEDELRQAINLLPSTAGLDGGPDAA